MYRIVFFVVCVFAVLPGYSANAESFKLWSPELAAGKTFADAQVFNGFGCTGLNISPELKWSGVPAGTKSLALTVYDPDAPTGSGWWHWLIFNIPADTKGLAQGAGDPSKSLAPTSAIQSLTDYRQKGYGGPCPPVGHGIHHYHFTLFALKTEKIDLDSDANPALVGYYLNQNKIDTAKFTAVYQRK